MSYLAVAALLALSPPPDDLVNVHHIDAAKAPTVVPGIALGAQVAFRKGIALALRAPPDYDGALAAFRRAVALDPGFVEAHLNIAAIHRARRASALAEQSAANARAADPNNARVAAYSANLKAALLLSNGDLDAADEIVRSVLRADPQNVTALNSRALIFLRSGKLALARWVLEQKVLPLDPSSIEAHTNLGQVFVRQRDLPAAVAHFRTAIHLAPGNVEARLNVGAIELDFLNYAAALAQYAAVLKRAPRRVEAIIGHSSSIYGLGDARAAIAGYQKALALDASRTALLLRIARLFEGLGADDDLRQAIAFYRSYVRARRLDDDDPAAAQAAGLEQLLELKAADETPEDAPDPPR